MMLKVKKYYQSTAVINEINNDVAESLLDGCENILVSNYLIISTQKISLKYFTSFVYDLYCIMNKFYLELSSKFILLV